MRPPQANPQVGRSSHGGSSRITQEGLSSPPRGTPRMISPTSFADKNVKAAKLHPGIDALLHPRHPGATPYRIVLGDVCPVSLMRMCWSKMQEMRSSSVSVRV